MKFFYTAMMISALLLNFASCVCAEDGEFTHLAVLEDLGAELLKPSGGKLVAPFDERLLEQLGEDVNVQQAGEEDWLSTVVEHMQRAQTLLEQTEEANSASAAQTEAITGLDTMITELAKRQIQCQGGQCQGGKCDKPDASNPSKKQGSSGKAGKSPAKGASSTTQSGADLSTEMAVAGELVKDLWGKLPERQRAQILQPLSEEFLPKYASEIEAYFRALADPKRSLPASP